MLDDGAFDEVLILIVVEERIGFLVKSARCFHASASLNPYCSGRKNRICPVNSHYLKRLVLILIVVEERIGYIL